MLCRTFRKLPGYKQSFLGNAGRDSTDYGFVPHLKYFLKRRRRWSNSNHILDRILTSVPLSADAAWEAWRQFRSAQAETTSMFLVENYFRAQVTAVEVARPGFTKSCDIRVCATNGREAYLEVKAQSGQQHGDKHPLCVGPIGFDPRFEEDLQGLLFDATVSSRTGAPMEPLCQQASAKGADVLIVMLDIFQLQADGLFSLGSFLVPDHNRVVKKNLRKRGILSRFFQKKLLQTFVFEAGDQTSTKLRTLTELWLFDNSSMEDMVIIRAKGAQAVFPVMT